MIVEYIRYLVPSARHAEFIAAYRKASAELDASPHCRAYELSRCHEEPTSYVVRIEWDSLAGHLQGFRGSSEFKRFFSQVQPFFEQIQEMRHYEVTDVAARKTAVT